MQESPEVIGAMLAFWIGDGSVIPSDLRDVDIGAPNFTPENRIVSGKLDPFADACSEHCFKRDFVPVKI